MSSADQSRMLSAIARDFASPGAAWRGKPFWAWNGELEPEELRRQIRVMRRMGLGGFFMHSRVGLATPYLSKRWFECVNACMDEAKKLKMEAWLYDEDRWPSGAAGGLVTKNPAWRQRMLRVVESDDPAAFRWTPDTLAAFTAVVKGHAASRRAADPEGPPPSGSAKGEKILSFEVAARRADQLVQRPDLPRRAQPQGGARVHPRDARGLSPRVRPGVRQARPRHLQRRAQRRMRATLPDRRDSRFPGPTRCRKSSGSATATICCRTCRNSATISTARACAPRATTTTTASPTSS